MSHKKPVLLDGAMGQEIVNRGGKSGYGEWAVAALYENPKIITEIHIDYLKAGADVITTNTYSTTRTRLAHNDMEDRLEELVTLAGKLAVNAREHAGKPETRIAASLGPLEASYISEFALSYDEMVAQFDELMTLLAPYVDIYLGETFSTTLEARAFLTAAQNHDKTTWVSWTLEDHGSENLRGGESLSDAIQSIKDFAPDAILVNCCTPSSISHNITTLRDQELPFGGYANGFVEVPEEWDPTGGVSKQIANKGDLSPQIYASHIQKWVEGGASIVGGCCDIGPAHIAQLRQLIDAR